MADLIPSDLILAAAKDFQLLIVILFFIGISLIVASMAEIQSGIIKINSENKRKAFLSGMAIAGLSGLILVAILANSMGVEVSGNVEYASGLPVRNANVYIGDDAIGKYHGKTNGKGEYKIADIPRNENLITLIIKGRAFYDTLDLPLIWPMENKKIVIMPIDLLVEGRVEDENGYLVEEAFVNISGEKDLSNKTDSMGQFNFGNIEVDPVPSKPLILEVRLLNEPRPRSKIVLEIPKEEPYQIYLPITLPPKDWVDVSGYVRLRDNYTDRNPKSMASVVVTMGGRTAQTKDDGSYIISRVPIETTDYAIGFADGKRLPNHLILPPLTDSYDFPRSRNLTVYKSELNMT